MIKDKDIPVTKFSLHNWNQAQANNLVNKAENVNIGDYIRLNYLVIEGERERLQAFEGLVIAKKGGKSAINATITVRRSTKDYNVERVIPCFSSRIDSIKVIKRSKVRRAKLFYLRSLKGKKARLTEKLN